jgi:hypothetical protein
MFAIKLGHDINLRSKGERSFDPGLHTALVYGLGSSGCASARPYWKRSRERGIPECDLMIIT